MGSNKELVDKYIQNLLPGNGEEIYKWKIIKQNIGHPDVNAADFAAEIANVKFHNQLYFAAADTMKQMGARATEPYREILKRLFDENVPLQLRIERYRDDAESLFKTIAKKKNLSAQHDERTIASILTYHNPGHYTFFKNEYYFKYCDYIGEPRPKAGLKYVHYLGLIHKLIEENIVNNTELLNLKNSFLDGDCYQDPNHMIFAQDILYFNFVHAVEKEATKDALNKDKHWYQLARVAQNIAEPNTLAQFFTLVNKLLTGLELNEDDPRVYTSVRMEKSLIQLTLGPRYVVSLEKKSDNLLLAFCAGLDDFEDLKHDYPNGNISYIKFGEEKNGTWSVINPEDFLAEKWTPRIVESNVRHIQSKGSQYRTMYSPKYNRWVIRVAKNPELIEELLNEDFENEIIEMEEKKTTNGTSKGPLNQILYGPPGTGKTYTLQQKFFQRFTTTETAVSRDQYIAGRMGEFSWWQVIGAALKGLGKAKVNEISNHELIKLKASVSASNTIKQTIWGQLQSHTVEECVEVKVAKKQSPLIFNKTQDSFWELSIDDDEEMAEINELYNLFTDFKPSSENKIKRYKFITFHQSFSYEDFIEGIKPILANDNADGEIGYQIVPGVFKEMCEMAARDPKNEYALFIDEINRGNVSNIFGELITLIEDDKRLGAEHEMYATLPYSKSLFGVPKNLYIIGTMNTADRSVEALDTALRRRFSFEEMPPNYELEGLENDIDGVELRTLLLTINERIETLLNRDHLIGHSYFLNIESVDELKSAMYDKIIPLLQEYFYGDYGKIGIVLGEGFVEMKKAENKRFAKFGEYDTSDLSDKILYSIKRYDDEENNVAFMEAVKQILVSEG